MNKREIVEEWRMTDTVRRITVEIIRGDPRIYKRYLDIITANPGLYLTVLSGELADATDLIAEREKEVKQLKNLMVRVRAQLTRHPTYRNVIMPFRFRKFRRRPHYFMMVTMIISPSLTGDPFTMSHKDRALTEELILSIGLPPEGL